MQRNEKRFLPHLRNPLFMSRQGLHILEMMNLSCCIQELGPHLQRRWNAACLGHIYSNTENGDQAATSEASPSECDDLYVQSRWCIYCGWCSRWECTNMGCTRYDFLQVYSQANCQDLRVVRTYSCPVARRFRK